MAEVEEEGRHGARERGGRRGAVEEGEDKRVEDEAWKRKEKERDDGDDRLRRKIERSPPISNRESSFSFKV